MSKAPGPQIVGGHSGKKSGGKPELNGRQKAAVFLVTIGSEISAEIFKHLREEKSFTDVS